MPKITRRHLAAIALLGTGLVLANWSWRTGLAGNISWIAWGLGIFLSAAGVMMTVARFARPAIVIPIAILCSCASYPLVVVLYWGIIISGIYNWPSQAAMVNSGYKLSPEARQIDALFGPAWHQTANYEEPNTIDWITVAFVDDRYELTMLARAEVNRREGSVLRFLDAPRFFLREVTQVQGRSVSYGRQVEFSTDDWQKVVAADGDLGVLGVTVEADNSIPGFDDYKKLQRGIQLSADSSPAIDE